MISTLEACTVLFADVERYFSRVTAN